MSTRYVIITPVRDEERFIEYTIRSVINQTVRPIQWIIVNDGSRDRTGQIAESYVSQHEWIRVIHRKDRGFRKSGTGVMEAFLDGYNSLDPGEWDFLVKLDGDLTFADTYFEKCFAYFERDPMLGIGGGEIHHSVSGQLQLEANPRFHVRGATKIYKRVCWDAIGGLWPAPGWDTIDEVKANMLGWRTHAFSDLHLIHHRFTGAQEGFFRDRVKHGVACYISRYHGLYVVASCLYRLGKKPYVVGSIGTLYGFLKSHFTRPPRLEERAYVAYIRSQQLRRLFGMQSIWR